MAATLIVETGAGLSNANSYVTAAEFAAYMDRIPSVYKTAFTEADVYTREHVLIWATSLLDNNIVYPSCSYRRFERQSLQFPRIGIIDQDGWLVSETIVPRFVKDATCQLAFELLKTDLSVEPTRGIQSVSVGPVSVQFDVNPSHQSRLIPRSVLVIVAPYGGVLRGSMMYRSVPLYRVS